MAETLKEGVGKRAELLDIFGGDCRRVVEMRTCTEQLQAILKRSHHSEDCRLEKSLRLCQSVEDVIISAEGDNAEIFRRRLSLVQLIPAVDPEPEESGRDLDDPVSPIPMQPQQKLDLAEEERAELLKELDNAQEYGEARNIVEQLFRHFDKNDNGELDGDECERAIDDLVMHVMREAAERSAKYGRRLVPREDVVRKWVWETVDSDFDGTITAQEAVKGFLKVVNDIDEQGEPAPEAPKL